MPLLKRVKADVKELIPRYIREYGDEHNVNLIHATSTLIISGTTDEGEIALTIFCKARRDAKGRFVGHAKKATQFVIDKLKIHYPDMEVE